MISACLIIARLRVPLKFIQKVPQFPFSELRSIIIKG